MTILIGVCGGSGSGKSTLAHALAADFNATCLSMDHYYLFGSARPSRLGQNFDHPDNIDWSLLHAHVSSLRRGDAIQRPIYNYSKGVEGFVAVAPAPVVIVEGLLILHDPRIEALFDVKIHLETDLSIQLARRLARDASERGIPETETQKMWDDAVAPMHHAFVAPQKSRAHFSLDSGQPMALMLEEARAALRSHLPALWSHEASAGVMASSEKRKQPRA